MLALTVLSHCWWGKDLGYRIHDFRAQDSVTDSGSRVMQQVLYDASHAPYRYPCVHPSVTRRTRCAGPPPRRQGGYQPERRWAEMKMIGIYWVGPWDI